MRSILALSLLALAACGADGAPVAPSAAAAPPPDAPIIGPDGNPVVISSGVPGAGSNAATEAF